MPGSEADEMNIDRLNYYATQLAALPSGWKVSVDSVEDFRLKVEGHGCWGPVWPMRAWWVVHGETMESVGGNPNDCAWAQQVAGIAGAIEQWSTGKPIHRHTAAGLAVQAAIDEGELSEGEQEKAARMQSQVGQLEDALKEVRGECVDSWTDECAGVTCRGCGFCVVHAHEANQQGEGVCGDCEKLVRVWAHERRQQSGSLLLIPNAMRRVLLQIHAERERQTKKWGVQRHDAPVWMLILMEEVGELSEALLKARFGTSEPLPLGPVREELIQVAAVAVAMAEAIDGGGCEVGMYLKDDMKDHEVVR